MLRLTEIDAIFDELRALDTEEKELEAYKKEVVEFTSRRLRRSEFTRSLLEEALHDLLKKEDKQSVKTPKGGAHRRSTEKLEYDEDKIVAWAIKKHKDKFLKTSISRSEITNAVKEGTKIPGVKVVKGETIVVSLHKIHVPNEQTAETQPNDRRSLWKQVQVSQED